jgi:chromosome segregation ATPase
MARGITQAQVNQAADALLQRGIRPTIEKLRAELGTGSPNTLMRMVETWWSELAERLAAQARADVPGLPEPVQRAMQTLWSEAVVTARQAADAQVAEARQVLEREQAALATERSCWAADLDAARGEAAHASEAQTVAERRLADHQRLVEQLQIELRDVKAQRDKLQEQADMLVQDMLRLGAKLDKQEKAHATERASTAAHVRAVEDRAHAEVDRARAEAKALRGMLDQAERSRRTAEQTTAKEHREHANQLRVAERDAAAQRARAEALEDQLKRLGDALPSASPATPRGARGKKQTVDPLAELREYFEAMVAKMQTPEARAAGEALSAAAGHEIGIAAVAQAAKERKSKRKHASTPTSRRQT